MSSTQDSLHSLSTHPDWSVTGDDAPQVDDEDRSPLLNQASEAPPQQEARQLGFKAGQCAALYQAKAESKSLLLLMAYGLASLKGPDRCLGQIELPFNLMPGPIAADQVKSKLADARVKLMKIVNRWERSGNGFKQLRDEEEEDAEYDDSNEGDFDPNADVPDNFGHLIDENYLEGNNRKSFVWCSEGEKDHHLYFWHLLDSQGVLSKVINKLEKMVAVDCDSELPDVVDVGHRGSLKRKGKDQEVNKEKNFRLEVGGALAGLMHQAMIENRDRVRRTVNEYKVLRIREQSARVKDELSTMVEEAQCDLVQIERQMVDYEKKHNLHQKQPAKNNNNEEEEEDQDK